MSASTVLPPAALAADVVLSVESLTKLPSDVHEVRYRPTMSIFLRMRDRNAGYTLVASDAGGADIDSDEDDDDLENEADELIGPGDAVTGASLDDVTFTVPHGQAVALVGRDDTPLELARVLSGMIAPTSGRVVAAGRISPGFDLLMNLARREPHPRRAARALAALVGVPRSRRSAYVDDLLERVIDEDTGKQAPKGRVNPLVRRIALAAQFDRTADVLVVDTWPTPRAFGATFVEEVQAAADRGAAVLVVNPPPIAAAACTRAIWLEHGRVVRDGSASDVLSELAHAVDEDRRRKAHVVLGFDDHLAIQAVEIRRDGRRVHSVGADEEIDVVVHLDAAEPLETLACTVSFRGSRGTIDFEQDSVRRLVGAGRHAIVLHLPAGTVLEGDYAVDAAFVAEHGSGTSRLAWPQAARVRVVGLAVDDETLAVEAGIDEVPEPGAAEAAQWEFLDDPAP